MKLTLPQQDVYFEQLFYAGEPIYNIGAKIVIKGTITYKILNEAYIALINQHDAYRGLIHAKDDNVEIVFLEEYDSALEFIDFSKENFPKDTAEEFMKSDFQKAFQFEENRLLHRFVLLKVNEQLHYLYSKYHHIITDGWGTSLMFQRLVLNYNELATKGKIETQYPYRYRDFGENDAEYALSDDYKKDALYWTKKFEALPDPLLNKIDETKNINKSKRKELFIKRSTYNKMIEVSKTCRASTFHFILGLLFLYFSKKHQKEELVIGVPVLNRGSAKFKRTVGLFMGISPLKIKVDRGITFYAFLELIRQQLRSDYRHQRFPLGKLVNELGLVGKKRNLFNITLSYEKQDYSNHFLNTETRVIPLTHESERTGLAIYIREFDESEDVKIDLDYNINYFDEAEIDRVGTHITELLEDVLENPEKQLQEYDFLSAQEKETLLNSFNNTRTPYDISKTVLSSIEDAALKDASKIAIRDKHTSYSYKELIAKSDNIASFLYKRFEKDNELPIAVLMDRSADMVLILLGIMKSGRPYIPLDPTFPKDRLQYIIEHSKTKTIIGSIKDQEVLNLKTDFIDAGELVALSSDEISLPDVSSKETAYIIYTSGSTGKPKGVEIRHRSLLNFLLSIQNRPGLTANDLFYSVTTPSFDISILEFFAPLISGASLYIADRETLQNPKLIIEDLLNIQPSIVQATPSFYQMLFSEGWKGDRNLKVLCGGDSMSEALAQKLLSTTHSLWNMYGPTETTIWSSVKLIKHPSEASNIGKPIQNTSFYILDSYKQLLPVNTEGNLYIGGDGLAKGYSANKALTEKKFIPNPFNEKEYIYETGDLGKWNSDGEISFLGRNDLQIKIRGFRIELGDIEAQLNAIETIEASIVIGKKKKDQTAFLAAFLIPEKKPVKNNIIISFLRNQLPDYMVPHTIVWLKEFPLTPNKKVDRKELAQREIAIKGSKKIQKPENEIQRKLYKHFQKALQTKSAFNISDSFFALRGHSLNAIRLIGYIEDDFKHRLSLKDLFDYPDIISLANYIENKKTTKNKVISLVENRPYYPATFPQYTIWLASIQAERSVAYNMFGAYTVTGELDAGILKDSFRASIDRYEILRTNFIEVNGIPFQKIKSKDEVVFEVEEFFMSTAEYENYLEEYANKQFDLINDILIRVAVFRIHDGDDLFVFGTHHIIVDGWSLELMIKEIVNRYKSIVEGSNLELPQLKYQFKDYAVWQNNLQTENEVINRDFWVNYLDGYEWKALIPYHEELVEDKYRGELYSFSWSKECLNTLNDTAIKNNITLHTLLMASFHVLLHKMYGLDSICLGTINSGRTSSGLNNHIGMFVKTLPLVSRIKPSDSFLSVVEAIHQDLLDIDEHQDIPEDVLNTLRFEAIFVLQNQTFNYGEIEVTDTLTVKPRLVIAKYNRIPMLVDFALSEGVLRGCILYDTSKYNKETMTLLIHRFEKLLKDIIHNIQQPIELIDIDLAFEKEEAIDIDFNF